MKIALDSDVCIQILRGKLSQKSFFSHFGEDQIFLTSPTIFELYRGLYKIQFSKSSKSTISEEKFIKELQELDTFFQSFTLLAYNAEAAKHAAYLTEILRSRGEEIGIYDCQIAGTLFAHNVTNFVTFNIKHYSKIEGLTVFDLSVKNFI